MTVLGSRIDKRLKALGKTQQWLADQVGMRQQSINSIIKKSVKRPGKLREIAVALETSQEYLLGETDDPTPLSSYKELFEKISRLSVSDRQIVDGTIDRFLEKTPAPKAQSSRRRKDDSKHS